LLCLRVITINPALVSSDKPGHEGCIIGGNLALLTDINTLLLLITCQNPGHNDMMHAQFSSQNLLACPITNSDLISEILNGSTSILMDVLLKFGYSVICHLNMCTSHALFSEQHLSNHCHGLCCTFCEICTKSGAYSLCHYQIHCEIKWCWLHNSK
jgi:hypothetical protein